MDETLILAREKTDEHSFLSRKMIDYKLDIDWREMRLISRTNSNMEVS
jgi:hypothetical protein